jgi:lipopolysaccharide/colanic/teichoic acid biosynthesis glycosyltransferase
MVVDAPQLGGPLTQGSRDPRITPVGRLLRKTKIDELPQLWNVACGEMSLVGPRPEVAKYVEMFRDDYAEILRVRPGITDPASIKYRDEAAELEKGTDPEAEYVGHILPDKIALAKQYIREWSLWYDVRILWETTFGR